MNRMGKIGAILGACAVAAACAWAADKITPLNVKTGYWETSFTDTGSSVPPVRPDALAGLTPEQRAQVEARLKAGQAPQTRASKHCVTREDLAKVFRPDEGTESCKQIVVAATSSSQDFKIECAGADMTATGTGHIEASDTEHMKGRIRMTMIAGGQTLTIETQISSKWLAAVCPASK